MASDSPLNRSPFPIRSLTPLAIPAERVLSKELTEKLHTSPTTTANVKNAFAFGPIRAFNFENLDIIKSDDDSKQILHIIAENNDNHRHHRKSKRNLHKSTRSTMETLYKDIYKEVYHHHPHNVNYNLSDKLTENRKMS